MYRDDIAWTYTGTHITNTLDWLVGSDRKRTSVDAIHNLASFRHRRSLISNHHFTSLTRAGASDKLVLHQSIQL
jgi:hypothetical protein